MHSFDENARKDFIYQFMDSIPTIQFWELARKLGASTRKIQESRSTDLDRFEVLYDWWECTGGKTIGLHTLL